jgi:hypothetical protein
MTTIEPRKITCGLCGMNSNQMVMMSTNQFGSPDLDLRPPEMKRSTMWVWVHTCPHCGYCASDLASPAPRGILGYVNSKEYQAQLNHPEFPELARKFLCSSMLDEYNGDNGSAGWSALNAAWACDDEAKTDLAIQCRKRAIDQFLKVRDSGRNFAEDFNSENAILADLYRRTNQDSQLRAIVQQGLAINPEPLIARILNFQLTLSSEVDRTAHRIDEVP